MSATSGLYLNGRQLSIGDVIAFDYEDHQEETGIGTCTLMVEFEKGCFVAKQIDFNYTESNPPETLYSILNEEKCRLVMPAPCDHYFRAYVHKNELHYSDCEFCGAKKTDLRNVLSKYGEATINRRLKSENEGHKK